MRYETDSRAEQGSYHHFESDPEKAGAWIDMVEHYGLLDVLYAMQRAETNLGAQQASRRLRLLIGLQREGYVVEQDRGFLRYCARQAYEMRELESRHSEILVRLMAEKRREESAAENTEEEES